MTTTKSDQFRIVDTQSASLKPDSKEISSIDQKVKRSVTDYQAPKLTSQKLTNYADRKKVFGSLAATDVEKKAQSPRDLRFKLNDAVRDSLEIEREEQRAIETRIEKKVEERALLAEKEARERGYQDGLKSGKQEALEGQREILNGKLQEWESFFKECEESKSAIFKENEKFLIDLVFEISKAILLRELAVDREYCLRLSQELVQRLGENDRVKILIAPQDAERVQWLKESLQSLGTKVRDFDIQVSEEVRGGGCKIQSSLNRIDATVETQLKRIAEALKPS